MHGGNSIEKYVDTEAVRVDHDQLTGLPVLLKEVHNRYSLPMAITEVHLNCTREEQLRWFKDVWETSCSLKREGLDILAVTAWSLFGAYGWNHLLTTPDCDYEAGVFDLRAKTPRPTALAKMISAYAQGTRYTHPVLSQPGWWKREDRFEGFRIRVSRDINAGSSKSSPPLFLVGKNRILSNAFAHMCEVRSIPYVQLEVKVNDLPGDDRISEILRDHNPWAIINADGDLDLFKAVLFAKYCNENKIPFMSFSYHEVFDGSKCQPYVETDERNPSTEYGNYMATLENHILEENPDSLLIRTGPLFGPWDTGNFAHKVLASLKKDKHVVAAEDVFISPSYVPEVVNTSLDLLIDEESGIWHLANSGTLSWFDFARELCERAGYPAEMIVPTHSENRGARSTVLGSERSSIMPAVPCALSAYFAHFVNTTAGQEHLLQKT